MSFNVPFILLQQTIGKVEKKIRVERKGRKRDGEIKERCWTGGSVI